MSSALFDLRALGLALRLPSYFLPVTIG